MIAKLTFLCVEISNKSFWCCLMCLSDVLACKMYIQRLPSFENVCFYFYVGSKIYNNIKKTFLIVKCFKVQIYSEFKKLTHTVRQLSQQRMNWIWNLKDYQTPFLSHVVCCSKKSFSLFVVMLWFWSNDAMPLWKYNTHIFSVVVGYEIIKGLN